ALDLQGGGRVYYAYDADKQRSRKRLERGENLVEERIDLGGLEIYRKYRGGALVEEIESVHLFEGEWRGLWIDDVLETDNPRLNTGPPYRYQYNNHLGSASLGLDDHPRVLSYEEDYPYGRTSYQAVNKDVKTAAKRYRYTGKERDEESGLYYYGARYYAPWLGRWVSCDPAGIYAGINLYASMENNPIRFIDNQGRAPRTPAQVVNEIKNVYQQRIEAEHVISELENQLDRKLTFVESLKVHNPNPDREVRKFIKGAESQIKDLEKQLAKEGARVQTLERSLTELTKEGAKL